MALEKLFENSNCAWIDCINPDAEHLSILQQQYGIDKLLLEDIMELEHLPKYEETVDVKFFLTRESLPEQKPHPNTLSNISMKLGVFIVKNTIITIHRLPSGAVQKTLKEIESSHQRETFHTANIALKLAHRILNSFTDEEEKIFNEINKIGSDIFLYNRHGSNEIKHLYRIKRKAELNSRVLSLSNDWVKNFNNLKLSKVEINNLIETQKNITSNFDHLNSQITNTIELYLALSDQRNNEIMKILSVYSVYFLPITFIAGIYGMNFHNMPELGYKYAYYIALSVMAIIVIVTFLYLKKKQF